MKIISLPTVSTREDFEIDLRFRNAETGDLIELSPSTDAIVFDVADQDRCIKLSASLSNGKITIIGTGVARVRFGRPEMISIYPSEYTYGLTFERDGQTVQVAKGALTVTDGIVHV